MTVDDRFFRWAATLDFEADAASDLFREVFAEAVRQTRTLRGAFQLRKDAGVGIDLLAAIPS